MFPDFFTPMLSTGVTGQALSNERGECFEVHFISLRHYSPNDYKGVDDSPFGGGAGMVMRADVLKHALIEGVVKPGGYPEDFKNFLHVVYPSPRGEQWNSEKAKKFASTHWGDEGKDLVFICGRYEGIDERFVEAYVDEQISLGDYVLTAGDLAVMTIIDSAIRFVPGALGNRLSAEDESFATDLLEYPQYTRPRDFEGKEIPKELLSGNHKLIEQYRQKERERLTKKHRPDLYKKFKGEKA
jgi:tRNA (guanine37-N1)-methyltransferase